jgi:hypothetical protein
MWAAADAGDETARQCRAVSVETILEKLTRHFGERARGGGSPPPNSKQES